MSQGRELERVVALLDELESEYGGERGWMRKASKRMGDVDPSLFSKWREGPRNLRSDTLGRICDGLKIRPSFFTDEWPVGAARSYKDYLLKPGERSGAPVVVNREAPRPPMATPAKPEPRVERDHARLELTYRQVEEELDRHELSDDVRDAVHQKLRTETRSTGITVESLQAIIIAALKGALNRPDRAVSKRTHGGDVETDAARESAAKKGLTPLAGPKGKRGK